MKRRFEPVTAVQIGGYPPPHGGVTVHVEELVRRLRQRSVTCSVLVNGSAQTAGESEPGVFRFGGSRPRQLAGMLRALRDMEPRVVHVHMAYGANALPWAALFTRTGSLQGSLLTIHSGLFPAVARSLSGARRALYRKTLASFTFLIAVSTQIRTALLSLGIEDERIRTCPAYFPPDGSESARESDGIADLRRRCGALVFVSGFMDPVWGIQMAAQSLHAIRECSPGLVIVQSGDSSPAYEREVLEAVPDPDRVVWYREVSHERFLSLLNASDIYLRASQYDGDSNAVREALACGKTVVASNCVERPEGCLLFDAQSQAALDHALHAALLQRGIERRSAPVASSEILLELYDELLGNRGQKG